MTGTPNGEGFTAIIMLEWRLFGRNTREVKWFENVYFRMKHENGGFENGGFENGHLRMAVQVRVTENESL